MKTTRFLRATRFLREQLTGVASVVGYAFCFVLGLMFFGKRLTVTLWVLLGLAGACAGFGGAAAVVGILFVTPLCGVLYRKLSGDLTLY